MTDTPAGALPFDDDVPEVPAPEPQISEQPAAPAKHGLTGNLSDAENAMRGGKYDAPRAPAQARGLFAALGVEPDTEARSVDALTKRYLMPPFSVLNAREGAWQDRKRKWIGIGIKSELGRGNTLLAPEQAPAPEQMPEQEQAPAAAEQASAPAPVVVHAQFDDDDIMPAAPVAAAPRRGKKQPAPAPLPEQAQSLPGGLTWGDSAQMRHGTLNYYREREQEKKKKTDFGSREEAEYHRLRADSNRMMQKQGAPRTAPDGRPLLQGLTGFHQGLGVLKDDAWLTEQSGTSIFDPVLTECCYIWFSAPGAMILDPFAGGSVRGIVAGMLQRGYTGVDLRREQIYANNVQAQQILPRYPRAVQPQWITGDSRDIVQLSAQAGHAEPYADYLFTCPPYADLEVYSDDPRDISTLSYDEFRAAYRAIIAASCSLLKQDRFATCVIGECRSSDEGGPYYGLVPDTIAAFTDAGLRYYNEQVLITMVGSLPLRTGKQFDIMRKIGKTHQNVLTFVKGDPRKASEACGAVDVSDPLITARPER